MKILLLTPIHREFETKNESKVFGVPFYQGQVSWIRALIKLDHEVDTFIYTDVDMIPQSWWIRIDYLGRMYFPKTWTRVTRKTSSITRLVTQTYKTRTFLKKCELFKPDLIIISGGITGIHFRAIQKIKNKLECKIILMEGVNPIVSATPEEKELLSTGTVDLVVENDRGYAKIWKKLGARRVMVLPISSVDPLIHKLSINKKYNVTFVGSLLPERIVGLEKIVKQIPVLIWGDIKPGVHMPKTLIKYYQGSAFGKEMISIISRSKISLNFQPPDMESGGNMRTFEIPGCGSFQLVDKVDDNWFCDKREIIRFVNIKDAIAKIQYFLEHDRERSIIARAGYRKALKEHTYEKHFEKLISQV